jgi:uncharacterized protein (TIGR03086 family)
MTSTTTTTPFLELATDDPRSYFGRAMALAGATVAAVTDAQRGLPTPCDDMDARGLMGHLVTVLRRVTALGAGTDPMAMPPSTEVADDGWVSTWAEHTAQVEAAWPDERLDAMMTLPWASMPGRAMLAQYTNELSVHTWDLATATGQHPAWDEQVLAVALAAIQRGMPAEGRAERFAEVAANLPAGVPFVPPFAEAVAVADDAPLIDRLVAWNGRTPR